MEVVDGSFKKPGAIPFKWEVQPGVPKLEPCHHEHQDSEPFDNSFCSCYSMPSTPHKLTPPPSSFRSCSTPTRDQLRSSSIRSLSGLRSDGFEYDPPLVTRSELVSTSYFLAPWLKWKWVKKKSIFKSKSKSKSEHEPSYNIGG